MQTPRSYLFLCRKDLRILSRLCLAIFLRRFFFTEPILIPLWFYQY